MLGEYIKCKQEQRMVQGQELDALTVCVAFDFVCGEFP